MDPAVYLSQDLLCNIASHVYTRTKLYMAALRNRQLLSIQQWRLRRSSGTTVLGMAGHIMGMFT